MYYEQLQAFVTFSTAPRSEGKPRLHARAWLSCHHCRNIVEVTGPQIHLQAEKDRMAQVMRAEITDFPPQMLQEFVHRQMIAFRVNQTCAQCGSISTLPTAHFDKMKKELSRLITAEWLNTQIDSLVMCAPFRAHQEERADARIINEAAAAHARQDATTP